MAESYALVGMTSQNDDLAQAYLAHATDLLSLFSWKHGEITLNRNMVRQRVSPFEELKGKRLITVKQAKAFGLVYQMRSYFDRAIEKIEVMPENNTKKQDEVTTLQEKWLSGNARMVNSRSGFVYSNAIWHGLESGEMILQLVFNPYLAKMGKYPFQPRAVDPLGCAYEWTEDGLGCFVIDEVKTAGALYKELYGYYQRASRNSVVQGSTTASWLAGVAREKPTTPVRVTRYYDAEREYMWIQRQLLWARPHHIGCVPFTVGYFFDMPAEPMLPHERGRGMISPIRDLLTEQDTLWDIYATDTELGSRPLVLYHDQTANRWSIKQAQPGANFDSEKDAPPHEYQANPNYQLLTQLGTMLDEQIEANTFPTFGQLRGRTSGFALQIMMQPVQLRMDSLRPGAELCLATHYEMLLRAYKELNTQAYAKALVPDNPETYLNSFAVATELDENIKAKKRQKSWLVLDPKAISDTPQVKVSLKSDLPTDKGAQMQQFELAMRSGDVPRTWAWKNILDVDDPAQMQLDWQMDWVLKNNQNAQTFFSDMWFKEVIESDPDLEDEFRAWGEAQQQAMQGQQGGMPSPNEFAAQEGQGGQPGMPGAAPPPIPGMGIGPGMPPAPTMGMNNNQPQGMPQPQESNFLPPQGPPKP